MAKKNYHLSKDQSKIIADIPNLTKEEKAIVQMYVNAGKILVPKRTTKDKITKKSMLDALKDDEEGLKILNQKIADKENFMKIVSWFRTYTKPKEEK